MVLGLDLNKPRFKLLQCDNDMSRIHDLIATFSMDGNLVKNVGFSSDTSDFLPTWEPSWFWFSLLGWS